MLSTETPMLGSWRQIGRRGSVTGRTGSTFFSAVLTHTFRTWMESNSLRSYKLSLNGQGKVHSVKAGESKLEASRQLSRNKPCSSGCGKILTVPGKQNSVDLFRSSQGKTCTSDRMGPQNPTRNVGSTVQASSHTKHTLGNPTMYAANFSQSSAISGTATTAANFSQSSATSGMDVRMASQASSHATHTLGNQNPTTAAANHSQGSATSGPAAAAANQSQGSATSGTLIGAQMT